MNALKLLPLLLLVLLFSACGNKGDLFLKPVELSSEQLRLLSEIDGGAGVNEGLDNTGTESQTAGSPNQPQADGPAANELPENALLKDKLAIDEEIDEAIKDKTETETAADEKNKKSSAASDQTTE